MQKYDQGKLSERVYNDFDNICNVFSCIPNHLLGGEFCSEQTDKGFNARFIYLMIAFKNNHRKDGISKGKAK